MNAVAEALLGTLKELDLRRHFTVQKAAEMLDIPSFYLLFESQDPQGVSHPQMRSMRDAVGNAARATAISRLLEMGALRTKYLNILRQKLSIRL